VEGNRELAVEIVAFAMEERVLLHVNNDVEVARRATLAAVLALAVQAEPLPGRDTRGNLDGQRALAADPSGAATGLARLGDRLSRPAAVRARSRDGQKTLLITELAGTAALGARFGPGARGGSGARTGFARLLARNLNRRFRPGCRFLERDFEVVPQVGAALRTTAPAA
jgi:hypothetical protein